MMDNTKIKEMFDFLASKELIGWDKTFFESVQEWFAKRSQLSEKQYNILARIKEKFNPQTIQDREEWAQEYKTKHLRTAKIIATYYVGTGYFTALSNDILTAKGFVPSRKQWKAIAENKYAQKVLATYSQEPAYEVGALVSFRATTDIKYFLRRHQVPSNGAVVVEYLDEVLSHAKGAKRVKVLPIGTAIPVITEERYLKKFRKQK